MIKAVIFDMDNLIIDSEPLQSKALEILLRQYGKIPIFNKENLVHTVGMKGTYGIIKDEYKLEESVEVLRAKKRRIYSNLLKKGVDLIDGFLQLIKILKEHDLKIALASNRNMKHIKLILNQVKIIDLFHTIVGPSEKINPKPSPDIYLSTAKKLKVKPKECLVLEDSETGVIAGKDAGMKVIAVPNIYTQDQNFSRADLIVNSLKDIKWSTISKL